jgi:hypothetical protein
MAAYSFRVSIQSLIDAPSPRELGDPLASNWVSHQSAASLFSSIAFRCAGELLEKDRYPQRASMNTQNAY